MCPKGSKDIIHDGRVPVGSMSKDLSEALDAAKKRRGVFSKTIIWESGVSKSQFYRIIKGQESPSAESKSKISKSLGLDAQEFDILFLRSKSESPAPIEASGPKNNSALKSIGIGVVLMIVFGLITNIFQRQNSSSVALDTASVNANVVTEEDNTLFIKDVTIPDGTSIPVNTTFVKTWRVKNVGNVVWKDRYLKRMTPLSNLICSSPAMVPIPETYPGETIDISVTFKTPHLPGSCRTDWKTSDYRGNLYFPDMHGLFSIVTVVEE